jgi:hypothetical protein
MDPPPVSRVLSKPKVALNLPLPERMLSALTADTQAKLNTSIAAIRPMEVDLFRISFLLSQPNIC